MIDRRLALLGGASLILDRISPGDTPLINVSVKSSAWLPDQAFSLSIGTSIYDSLPNLRTATNDASLIAVKLARLGFQSYITADATYKTAVSALHEFGRISRSARILVIYVAGHGSSFFDGSSFLTRDAKIFDGSISGVLSEHMLLDSQFNMIGPKVFLLDYCRNTFLTPPGSRFNSTTNAENFLLYSAQPGAFAHDGRGSFGPFATALSDALDRPNLSVEEIARAVRRHVILNTSGKQVPWSKSSLISAPIINRESK